MKKIYFFLLVPFLFIAYGKLAAQNVGVGTTNPASKLEIQGLSGDENSAGILRLTNTSGNTQLRMGTLDGSRSWIQSHASLPLHINRLGNNVILNETAGNVGIGTANPDHRLVVGPAAGGRHLVINDIAGARWGLATGGYDLSFQNDFGGTWNTRVIFTEGGNVGIGTTTPSARLVVNQSGSHEVAHFVQSTPTTHNVDVWWRGGSATTDWLLSKRTVDGSGDFWFWSPSSGASVLTLKQTGNVGIGINSPSERLHVVGNVRISSLAGTGIRKVYADAGGVLTISSGGSTAEGAATVVPIALFGGEPVINSTSWQRVTRTNYNSIDALFAGIPVTPGATRKYYVVIRRADNQPGGTGSYWRFSCDGNWNSGNDVAGHGFSLPANWGSLSEGSTDWIEIPPTAVSGSGCGTAYWKIDARMANAGQSMRVMSISIAAVDVVGGTHPAYSVATSGNAALPALSWLYENAWSTGTNVGIGTSAPATRLHVGPGSSNSSIQLQVDGRMRSNSPAGGLWLSDANDGFIGNNGTNVGFWTNGVGWNALQIVKSTGSVLIGTTVNSSSNPRLLVQRAGGAGGSPEILTSDGTQWTLINSHASAGSYNPITQVGDHTIIFSNGTIETGGLTIAQWSNNARGLRIAPDGNVGIGTGSPAHRLDVQGGNLRVGTMYGPHVMLGTLGSFDTRSTNPNPDTYHMGVISEFKQNNSNGLVDGGTYNSVLSIRHWSSGNDWSGGGVHQLGFTENGNLWHRYGTTAWGPWRRVLTTGGSTSRADIVYVRGTGLNNNANRVVRIGGVEHVNNSSRGLTLTIVNKSNHAVVSSTNYDTYGSTAASDALATALNNINNGQIGILTSYDAWEDQVTTNLKNAFRRLGLYKALMTSTGARRPYAAIFEASSNSGVPSVSAVEIEHSNDGNQPYAELRGWLIDGAFVATTQVPSGLSTPIGGFAVGVNESGNVGIGTTTPAARLTVAGDGSGTAFIGGGFCGGNYTGISLNGQIGNCGVYNILSSPTDQNLYLNRPSGAAMFFRENNGTQMVIASGGNVGIGTTSPSHRLHVAGTGRFDDVLEINRPADGTNAAIFNMINPTSGRYWHNVVRSGDNDKLQWHRWNGSNWLHVLTMDLAGNVGINASSPAVKLAVNGNGGNIYATDVWVENNMHVQGNETLTQGGGRGRLRVGTAWGYVGLYADGATSGSNDLILGASSGVVRVGPNAGSGQNLRWANSFLRDDQGGSIELGGANIFGGGGGTGTPYIDFHVNDGYTRDYDARIIAATDQYGPIIRIFSHYGSTHYQYFDLDWIGTYDCWADVSAWRYFANASDWLYYDRYNDLDLIDNIKPLRTIDPKTNEPVMANDPTTVPSFLIKKTYDNPQAYRYDINRVSWFSIGAIRQLRKETKTKAEDLEKRVERLEALLTDLTGKKLERIPFVGAEVIHAGLNNFVVIDSRITKDDNIVVSFRGDFVPSYKIQDVRNGSFEIVFSEPLKQEVKINYTVE